MKASKVTEYKEQKKKVTYTNQETKTSRKRIKNTQRQGEREAHLRKTRHPQAAPKEGESAHQRQHDHRAELEHHQRFVDLFTPYFARVSAELFASL